MKPLAIGTLARETGVKVPTIRYYESVGLLPRPDRAGNNRRVYGPDTVRRLRFIRHARELGFEPEAIRQLLLLSSDPDGPCEGADVIAGRHLAAVDDRIARLQALRGELAAMLEGCAHGDVRHCRVIEVLADHGQCATERH